MTVAAIDSPPVADGRVEPRRIDVPGADLEGVHYLRTLADADALRDRLNAGGHVAIVGAAWIGSEFAASARQRGSEVTLIDPLALPNERIFGSEIGEFYRDVHAQHGVELLLGTGVGTCFEGDRTLARVGPATGASSTATSRSSGSASSRAPTSRIGGSRARRIVVDDRLQSSSEGIRRATWMRGTRSSSSGFELNTGPIALNQGPAAAGAMLGAEVSYDRIPYFFSDQYDVGMEYSGHAPQWDQVIFRGDCSAGEFVAFWLRDGRVVAGMNVNVWDVNQHVQALIRSRRRIDVDALADVDTPLQALAGELAR